MHYFVYFCIKFSKLFGQVHSLFPRPHLYPSVPPPLFQISGFATELVLWKVAVKTVCLRVFLPTLKIAGYLVLFFI